MSCYRLISPTRNRSSRPVRCYLAERFTSTGRNFYRPVQVLRQSFSITTASETLTLASLSNSLLIFQTFSKFEDRLDPAVEILCPPKLMQPASHCPIAVLTILCGGHVWNRLFRLVHSPIARCRSPFIWRLGKN